MGAIPETENAVGLGAAVRCPDERNGPVVAMPTCTITYYWRGKPKRLTLTADTIDGLERKQANLVELGFRIVGEKWTDRTQRTLQFV